MKKWGYKFIRGSSNNGANNVLKDMKKHFSNNETICITSDGPKGPINIAKPSSIRLAMENNVTILPVSAISKRFWQINSWDRFIFPKPFSTIYMCVGDKINYKKENITNSYCSELISKKLITLQNINDNLIK